MSSCLLDFCEYLLHGSQKNATCVSYVQLLCSREQMCYWIQVVHFIPESDLEKCTLIPIFYRNCVLFKKHKIIF